jgi:hypothetical protein
MKKKINKNLLNEELKRFRQINEYSFYVPEDSYAGDEDVENLILGEQDPEDEMEDGAELEGGDEMEAGAELDGLEGGDEMEAGAELDPEAGDELAGLEGGEDELAGLEGGEDEIEIDVTQLVQAAEDSKANSEMTNQKLGELMGKFGELESKLSNMDAIAKKVNDVENQIEKRLPTPEEKLEMRSMDSFPYNLKLTDFWADKEGYNVGGGEDDNEEYVLTHDDVNDEYNENTIRDSFDEDEYEEEEFGI